MTTVKDAQLGHAFGMDQLVNETRAVWGAVAWPGKGPGYAVVLAACRKAKQDGYEFYLLEEFESEDVRLLVRKCGALNVKYAIPRPRGRRADSGGRWIGDVKHDAASRFIAEMNAEIGPGTHTPAFELHATAILDMENVYSYILPAVKEMLSAERRRLFLKDGRIIEQLNGVEPDEMIDFKIGEYPAIEAVAFAAIEMQRQLWFEDDRHRRPRGGGAYGDWKPGRAGRGKRRAICV
jgi:hypothetical protein